MKLFFVVAALGLGALAAADAVAQHSLSDADRAEIKAVISRQIAAFQRDDAAEAFSLASPGIQSVFGSPENFLHMVRMSYQPVYRPASVTFLGLSIVEDEAVQRVQFSDSSGALWLALYPMQKQKDGNWKTNGCQLFPLSSVST